MSVYRICLTLTLTTCASCQWLPKEAAQWAISEFEKLEQERNKIAFRGTDRRSSAPFISGDGFREYCTPHVRWHFCRRGIALVPFILTHLPWSLIDMRRYKPLQDGSLSCERWSMCIRQERCVYHAIVIYFRLLLLKRTYIFLRYV